MVINNHMGHQNRARLSDWRHQDKTRILITVLYNCSKATVLGEAMQTSAPSINHLGKNQTHVWEQPYIIEMSLKPWWRVQKMM